VIKTAPKPMTVADYRELPAGPPYYQLIEGELVMAPSPDRFHQDILGNLFFSVRTFLENHPLGKVYVAPSDVMLTELNVFQPDLYFVSAGRVSILTEQGASGAPDLVVEILSTRSAPYDKGIKREIYAQAGVEELWLIDPSARRVEVYLLQASHTEPDHVLGAGRILSSKLLPGLRISIETLFRQ
jgi:Uma2 family endonuclease